MPIPAIVIEGHEWTYCLFFYVKGDLVGAVAKTLLHRLSQEPLFRIQLTSSYTTIDRSRQREETGSGICMLGGVRIISSNLLSR